MPRFSAIVCMLATFATAADSGAEPLYRDHQAPVERRVDDLLGRLTLEEKVALCHGSFLSGGVPRLDIPQLAMLDGRQGVRPLGAVQGTSTTLLPCALALACTWDETAAEAFGRLLAEEMLALNQHVLLAPMINVVRSPLGGRNFENFSEDPLQAGVIAAAYVRGVQRQRVGACACLVAGNDCETRRHYTSANMDDRTLREVHLLPTELAFRDGHVWSMMSANSLLNGIHCAQNRHLLTEIVKDQIGFDGVMITDWRAAYDTVPAALAGTDMTTGFCQYVFGDGHLLEAVKSDKVPMRLLDDKVRRVLRLYVRCGVLDPDQRPSGELDTAAHRAAARRLGAASIVLLKNRRDVLPLDPATVGKVLVTGPAADVVLQGGGSGKVPAAVNVTPLEGLQNALADRAQVSYLPYHVSLQRQLQKGNIEWKETGKAKGKKRGAAAETIPDAAALTQAAKAADVVIFVAAGQPASEGRDLLDMELPGGQAQAIATLAEANPNVVVVLVANGAVSLEPWLPDVPAVLAAHYAGQAAGDAMADVLLGKVNPAAKLSYTFARRLEDYPCHSLGEWPAKLILDKDPGNPGFKPEERKVIHAYDTDYREGVQVGYRWFDAHQIEPVFPFGHGLSYTSFALSDLKVDETDGRLRVSCLVENTGDRAGAEVVQVYVAPPPSSVPRPPKELKGFARVMLQPGESRRVDVALRPSAFAYYDTAAKQWKADTGRYGILVGCSSRDIRLRATIVLPEDRVFEQF